ncbi:hypothetical protein AB7783_20060 [Tardiphaga sp. 172_B4_N1_3]|uniref:hypothetical protein n=1 Tax=Tardiphaga sp. 172_B4_N1_3 TaxID=3240787 RepID=UPI003F8968F1
MKNPICGPLEDVSPDQRSSTDPYLCYSGGTNFLGVDDVPPLCHYRETESEAYRFVWQSSFSGAALVHVARLDDSFRLYCRFLRHSRLYLEEPIVSSALSLDDWRKLQLALTMSDFWSLATNDRRMGFDGANLLIEGRRGVTYHAVDRWSPQGAVRDLGQTFFALAGSPFSEIELY